MLQHDAFDIEHVDHGFTKPVFGDGEAVGRRKRCKGAVIGRANARHGGTINKIINFGQGYGAAIGQSGGKAGRTFRFDKHIAAGIAEIARNATGKATTAPDMRLPSETRKSNPIHTPATTWGV